MHNEGLIRSLAVTYERYKDQFRNLTLEVIAELHDKVTEEFYAIKEQVTDIRFVPAELDDFELQVKPSYKSLGIINISSLNNNSELFPGNLNLWFRAWHDYIHLKYDYPFTFEGEYQTYLKQAEGLSYKAKQVLFSEIVLQTAYCVYYGMFVEKQKVVLIDIDLVNPRLD